jgi:transcriptional regulator with XRE-family HTH domain
MTFKIQLIYYLRSSIARLESADYNRPSYRTLEKIAEALGLELVVTLRKPKKSRRTIHAESTGVRRTAD